MAKNPVGPKPRPEKPKETGPKDKPIPSGKKNRPQYWRATLTADDGRAYEGTGPSSNSAIQAAHQFAIKRRKRDGQPPPGPANQMGQSIVEITDGPHPREL